MEYPTEKELAIFWSRVTKQGGGCWLHSGGLGSHGYPQSFIAGNVTVAHRVSYRIHHGDMPKGTVVRHTCDNRQCVNPDHLLLGTNDENMDDMAKRQRSGQSKLTWEQVRAIRADGRSQRKIAADYGIAQTSVGRILRGKCYKHAGGL